MFLDPSPRCSFVALKQLCTKKCGRNCRLDIGLVTIPGHQQFSRNHVMYWFPCPQPFPTFFWFWVCLPVSYDFTPWRIPGYPSTTSRPAEFRCLLLAIVVLGPMGFMGSNSRITGTLPHESEIKGTDFMANLQIVCRCVFFLYLDEVTLLF